MCDHVQKVCEHDISQTACGNFTEFATEMHRVSTVRESQGILRESGKTERVREKSGNFKIPLTRPIIYAYFHNFCRLLGALP